MPPNAQASAALLSFIRKYAIRTMACMERMDVRDKKRYSRSD